MVAPVFSPLPPPRYHKWVTPKKQQFGIYKEALYGVRNILDLLDVSSWMNQVNLWSFIYVTNLNAIWDVIFQFCCNKLQCDKLLYSISFNTVNKIPVLDNFLLQ